MKREFGAPVIEKFLPTKDVRFVIDSEGAWIPGHNMDGTPTVILIGRNTAPVSGVVRAVMSKTRRESPSSTNGNGPYWRSIVDHLDDPGYESEWLSVVDLERSRLSTHPWSLAGGGALELTAALENSSTSRLSALIAGKIGPASFPGTDDPFFGPRNAFVASGISTAFIRRVVTGDVVRDYTLQDGEWAFAPYDENHDLIAYSDSAWSRRLWPFRSVLNSATGFDRETRGDAGEPWWGWYRWIKARYATPMSLCFAVVASHNHVLLDRGGNVFNRHAPVIKLPAGAAEREYSAVLGLLNSSAICFWLKQVSQPKGGAADIPWSRTYEFTGTAMQDVPIPMRLPASRGTMLDELAREAALRVPHSVVAQAAPSRVSLNAARQSYESLRGRMVAHQEELDWEVYALYGLVDDGLTYMADDLPNLAFGERAFEIVLARRAAAGEEDRSWFERHGSMPIADVPEHWPDAYRDLVHRRIELIESDQFIRLLERPENKRRWASESWERQEERALRGWLLDRLEARGFWFDNHGRPTAKSIAVLADEVTRDQELAAALSLWERRFDVPVATSLEKLLATEAVPFLAAMRYKDSGLRRRAAWEATWALQRREDAGTYNPAPKDRGGDGPIPVPPKYVTGDFRKVEYWTHRGKLDVPKERFILYLGAGREGDPTPVLGWAGWDHAQQALALATLIQSGEQQGWSEHRLVPLVAGLCELLPWVEQWHGEPNALYGGSSPAEFFSGLLDSYMAKLGATRESLAAWRPPAPTRGRKAKS